MTLDEIRREAEVLGSQHGLRIVLQHPDEVEFFASDSTHRVNLKADLRQTGRRVGLDLSTRFGKKTAKTRDQAIEEFGKTYADAATQELWREAERLGLEIE